MAINSNGWGQIVFGIVSVVASYYGGPYAGLAVSMIGQALFPTELPGAFGPQINDKNIQTSSPGEPIPLVFGRDRLAGTVIWLSEIKENVKIEEVGGKGGGPVQEQTTFTYSVNFAVLICEGPIRGVRRIWAGTKVIYDRSDADPNKIITTAGLKVVIYNGTEDQQPDPTIESFEGVGNVPAWRDEVVAVFTDFNLSMYGNQLPSLSFEVVTDGDEAPVSANLFNVDLFRGWTTGPDPRLTLGGPAGLMNEFAYVGYPDYPGAPAEWLPFTYEKWLIYQGGVKKLEQYFPVALVSTWVSSKTYAEMGIDHHVPNAFAPGFSISGYGLLGAPIDSQNQAVVAIHKGTREPVRTYIYYRYANSPPPGAPTSPTFVEAMDAAPVGTPVGFFNGAALYDLGGAGPGSAAAGLGVAIIVNGPLDTPPPTVGDGFEQGSFYPSINKYYYGAPAAEIDDPTLPPYPPYQSPKGCDFRITRLPSTVADMCFGQPLYPDNPGYGIKDGEIISCGKNEIFYAHNGDRLSLSGVAGKPHGYGPTPFIAGEEVKFVSTSIYFPDLSTAQTFGLNATKICPPFAPDPYGEAFWKAELNKAVSKGYIHPGFAATMVYNPNPVVEQPDVFYEFGRKFNPREYPHRTTVYAGKKTEALSLDPNPVRISDIVRRIVKLCGLDVAILDTTEIDEIYILGYSFTRLSSGREILEPLMRYGFFDLVESGEKLKCRRRSNIPVATIYEDDLRARAPGGALKNLIEITRTQDVDLPRQVTVRYLNSEQDYSEGAQSDRRVITESVNLVDSSIRAVMSDQTARELAQTMMMEAWVGRVKYKFDLLPKWARLEPGDIINIDLPARGFTARVRIVTMTWQPYGPISVEAVRQDSNVYAPVTVGLGADTGNNGEVTSREPSLPLPMDAPALRNADTGPGYYVAMYSAGDVYLGSTLNRSDDGGASYSQVASTNLEPVFGSMQSALRPDADYLVMDVSDRPRVYMENGTLSSVSDDQLYNKANTAIIGENGRWEVIQFKNAELIEPGVYELSNILRGRYGSEWAVATHAVTDRFVLFSGQQGISRVGGEQDVAGRPKKLKAVTFGTSLEAALAVDFTPQSTSLRPYAVTDIQLEYTDDGTFITWKRRARVNASGDFSMAVPLDQSVEKYQYELYDGDTLVDSGELLEAKLEYPDTGGPYLIKIWQIGDIIGRGYPAEKTL